MRLLTSAMASLVLLLGSTPDIWAFSFLSSGDPIIAIDTSPLGDVISNSSYPEGEAPANVVDGTLAKYLNFGGEGSGFIVTPALGSSTVQSFVLTTANDAPDRDPTSWEIWGTNASIVSADNSTGLDESWSLIQDGAIALPAERDTLGPVVPLTNSLAYTSYKMVFPTLAGADLFQIAEASFYPNLDGTGTDILNFGDPVLAIHAIQSGGNESNYPGGEPPANAIDGSLAKYLNFGKEDTGFIVTPSAGAVAIESFQLTTANDAEARDPASWRLFGTNETISTPDNGDASGENWTFIDEGTLTLPVDRDTPAGIISVTNTEGVFASYRMEFPTLRDSAAANSMQIAEVEFFAPDTATLVIDRATGEVRIRADVDITFASYGVRSETNGLLEASNWSSIASTGADPNDTWTETSTTPQLLAEEENGPTDGFTIAAGNDYSLGEIWTPVPPDLEDIGISMQDASGNLIALAIAYTGDEVLPGDYNNDGAVNINDWPIFRAGYGGDFTGMSAGQAYLLGDLDQDFDSDIHDFNLFVELAGGAVALFGQAVPEPSSALMLAGMALLGVGALRGGKGRLAGIAVVAVAWVGVVGVSSAEAQTFTNVGGAPSPITIPAGQMNENDQAGPENLFDDTYLDDPGIIDGELFILDYNDPNLVGGPYLQYAGLGPEPKTVFFDYGSSVSANWFAYSQRSGGDPTADRVGSFEFWFSNTDFGGIVPESAPNAVVELLPSDPRLRDSALRPYSLSGTHSGRYLAMRLTVSELSINQPTNNIGGHEFRLLSGPADVVLEVDRADGSLTLKNSLSGAQNIEFKSYMIESPSSALDAAAFDGVGGASGFPLGDGSGNGWEIGGGSNATRIAEGYFSDVSTLTAGTSGISLGNGYNFAMVAEDLVFTWTNADGNLFNGRVEYVGIAPPVGIPGDYNHNGQVEQSDLDLVLLNWGIDVPPAPAGWDNPSYQPTGPKIDQDDLDGVLLNWGNVAAAGSAASVPEPSTACLLLAALAVAANEVRRKNIG